MTREEIVSRFPRLVRAMKRVAILSEGEACAAIRDLRSGWKDAPRWGGGEAVVHYGGPRKVVQVAFQMRHHVRRGF